jgi:hypothetical protein
MNFLQPIMLLVVGLLSVSSAYSQPESDEPNQSSSQGSSSARTSSGSSSQSLQTTPTPSSTSLRTTSLTARSFTPVSLRSQDFRRIRERQRHEENLNEINAVIALMDRFANGEQDTSLLNALRASDLDWFRRIQPISEDGGTAPIEDYEVFAWLVWLEGEQHYYASYEQIRELVGSRSISLKTFYSAMFYYSYVESHHKPLNDAVLKSVGFPLSQSRSPSQTRLFLELSFHGLTNIFFAGDASQLGQARARNRLLRVIRKSNGLSYTSDLMAYVEYFIHRGFLDDPYELLQIVNLNYVEEVGQLLLHRGTRAVRDPYTFVNLHNFGNLNTEFEQRFNGEVRAVITTSEVANLVIDYTGYRAQSIQYSSAPSDQARHWLVQGVAALLSWVGSCPFRLICKGKRSKGL